MGINPILRALVAALPAAIALPALAEIDDYEFQLTQSEFKQGDGVVITVDLIDKRSGKPVPDAVSYLPSASTCDRKAWPRWPLQSKCSQLRTVPTASRPIWSWRAVGACVRLAAKVQGETGTLANKLVLKALP